MIFEIQRFGGTSGRTYSPQNAMSSVMQQQPLNNQASQLMQNSLGASPIGYNYNPYMNQAQQSYNPYASSVAQTGGGGKRAGTPVQTQQNYNPYGDSNNYSSQPVATQPASQQQAYQPTSYELQMQAMQQQNMNQIAPAMQWLNNRNNAQN